MELNFAAMAKYSVYFQQGVIYTVLLSFFTVIFGFVLALVLAMMRIAKPGKSLLSKNSCAHHELYFHCLH